MNLKSERALLFRAYDREPLHDDPWCNAGEGGVAGGGGGGVSEQVSRPGGEYQSVALSCERQRMMDRLR